MNKTTNEVGTRAKGLVLIGKIARYAKTVEKALEKSKAEFTEAFAKNPSYALEWKAEACLANQAENDMAQLCCAKIVNLPVSATNIEVTTAIRELMEEAVRNYVRFPVRPSSTNVLANLIEVRKGEAASAYIRALANIIDDYRYL